MKLLTVRGAPANCCPDPLREWEGSRFLCGDIHIKGGIVLRHVAPDLKDVGQLGCREGAWDAVLRIGGTARTAAACDKPVAASFVMYARKRAEPSKGLWYSMSLWLPCGLHGFAVPNTVTVTVMHI
jgi:hypothetical protein